MIDTIVVGAGAAGLMAARELVRAGKRVLVLESRHRIGGRILTLHDHRAGVPIELGAEFVHGDAPETTRLLDEARLVTVPVLGKHYRSDRGELSPQGPAWERMARVFTHMSDRRKTDRSFQEFLDGEPGGPRLKAERELARSFVQGFMAADVALISEKSLAEQGDPTDGAVEARRIVLGYDALIEHLLRDIAETVRLGRAVQRIAWDDAGARVLDALGTEHAARSVVITVPLPMLQDDSIAIEPDVPAVRRAARRLVMGHVQRVVVVVRERFWDEKIDELAYLHAPRRPFNVWWTQHPLRAPMLVGWAGGPPASEMTEGGDVEGIAVAELARAFGIRRRRLETLIESIHRHDWTLDEHSCGAYSYAGVGGTNAPHALTRPVGDTLFFAGEATNAESSGTVEGAIASGKRAAKQVLTRLVS
ncbi:MAG: amine oxidase [Gemmatimonadetes bacterium]|nr:amine oxidase [Gemmatimonadota bacterium]